MQIGEHHVRDGLTFRRNDDGSVRVRVYGPTGDSTPPTVDVTIPVNEWESVEHELSWAVLQRRPADV